MKSRYLCGLVSLLIAPCALAVSFTQTQVVNLPYGATDHSIGATFPLLYFDGLTSVTFDAAISARVTAVNVNTGPTPSSPPQTFDQKVFLSTRFNLGWVDLPLGGFPLLNQAFGPSVTLYPGQSAYFTANLEQHYTTILSSPTDLADFYFGPLSTGLHFLSDFGGGNFGALMGGSATFVLTYEYTAPGVSSVPDSGATAALLAFVCCGLFFAAHRFKAGPLGS